MQVHAVGLARHTQPLTADYLISRNAVDVSGIRSLPAEQPATTEPIAAPEDDAHHVEGHGHERDEVHEGHDGEHVRGVFRLLEDGHFRGVADVRLRINFHEQLAARAQAAAVPVAAAGAARLADAVTAAAEDLLAPYATDPETKTALDGLLSRFDEAVAAAGDSIRSNGAVDTNALETSLQSAFDGLAAELQSLLAEPAGEPQPDGPAAPLPADTTEPGAVDDPTSGGTVPADPLAPATIDVGGAVAQPGTADGPVAPAPVETKPPTEPGATKSGTTLPSSTDALASVTDAFHEALSILLSSIDSTLQPPEPASPSGNGAAFDKFLAIYRGLRHGASLDEVG